MVDGRRPAVMHARFARALDDCHARIREIQAEARAGVGPAAPRARAGPRSCSARRRAGPGPGRSTACTSTAPSARTRCRWPTCGTIPRTWRCSRPGCAATGRRSSSTTAAGLRAELAALAPEGRPAHGRQPARQRRSVLRPLDLPDFADYAVPVAAAGHGAATSPPRQLGEVHARHLHAQPRERPTSGCSAPTRPTPTGWAPCSRSRTAAPCSRRHRRRRSRVARRPGDGGPERAPLPGLARGLPAHRPPRAVRDATRRSRWCRRR